MDYLLYVQTPYINVECLMEYFRETVKSFEIIVVDNIWFGGKFPHLINTVILQYQVYQISIDFEILYQPWRDHDQKL